MRMIAVSNVSCLSWPLPVRILASRLSKRLGRRWNLLRSSRWKGQSLSTFSSTNAAQNQNMSGFAHPCQSEILHFGEDAQTKFICCPDKELLQGDFRENHFMLKHITSPLIFFWHTWGLHGRLALAEAPPWASKEAVTTKEDVDGYFVVR